MDAVISGRSGTALLVEGNSLLSFDVDNPDTLVRRRQSDLPFLFGDAGDLQVLENVALDQIKRQLEFEYNSACALDLFLILLDPELSTGLRDEAAQELEILFTDTRIIERVEYTMYARPLPASADILGAIERSDRLEVTATLSALQDLFDRQPFVREVSHTWNGILAEEFGDDEQKIEFQRTAVREGLFRSLVIAYVDGKVENFLFTALLKQSIQTLRNYRNILQKWVAPFRSREALPIVHEYEEDFETSPVEARGRKRRHQRINRTDVRDKVERRKESILEHMQRRDFVRLRSLVEELIDFQMANGGPDFVVKSLCDLAINAKAIGNYTIQLELAERSINLSPDDGWSWAQYGDALLQMQRPIEALQAYEQAISFDGSVVAKSGRAEALKAMGRLNQALAAYNAVIADHPENVIAKTGRAEVLKALGQFNQALAAYDAVIADHPENAIAKNGRAEVLKALGQFNQALAAYDAVIADHPEDAIAKRGRAEVLKALGQFNQALAAYDAVIADHPEDAFARNGRSYVLAALHRYEEALKNLPEGSLDTLQDWIGYHIRGMILLRTGHLDEAFTIFEQGVISNPWPLSREYFRTTLGIVWILRHNYLKASEVLEEVRDPLLQSQADILLIHSYGEMEKPDLAAQAYDRLTANPLFHADELTDELHQRYIARQGGKRDNAWVSEQEIDNLFMINQSLTSSLQSHLY
jgi:tetratricopeptide (TPR) repeat protein